MVLGFETLGGEVAGDTDGLDHEAVVLTTARHTVDDNVSELHDQLVETFPGGLRLLLCGLHVGGELFGAGQQLGLLVALRLGDEPAEFLLLGTQPVVSRDPRAARLIGRDQFVDEFDGVPAGFL